ALTNRSRDRTSHPEACMRIALLPLYCLISLRDRCKKPFRTVAEVPLDIAAGPCGTSRGGASERNRSRSHGFMRQKVARRAAIWQRGYLESRARAGLPEFRSLPTDRTPRWSADSGRWYIAQTLQSPSHRAPNHPTRDLTE